MKCREFLRAERALGDLRDMWDKEGDDSSPTSGLLQTDCLETATALRLTSRVFLEQLGLLDTPYNPPKKNPPMT